jgi:hypothetical protein
MKILQTGLQGYLSGSDWIIDLLVREGTPNNFPFPKPLGLRATQSEKSQLPSIREAVQRIEELESVIMGIGQHIVSRY